MFTRPASVACALSCARLSGCLLRWNAGQGPRMPELDPAVCGVPCADVVDSAFFVDQAHRRRVMSLEFVVQVFLAAGTMGC